MRRGRVRAGGTIWALDLTGCMWALFREISPLIKLQSLMYHDTIFREYSLHSHPKTTALPNALN